MAQGIQVWDANGQITLDTNTITSRLIGNRVCSVGHFEKLTVALSAGKRLWWHFYTVGNVRAYCYRQTFVDPSLNQKENEFAIQVEPADYWSGSAGQAYVFWGEY